MSEILSEVELDRLGSGEWGSMRQFQVARLFASHRALQAERDALKAELIAWKHSAANEDCLREEINALKAELAEAKQIIIVLDGELRKWKRLQP